MSSVLIVNGGSSSIKFAVHDAEEPAKRTLSGKIDRIGLNGASLTYHDTSRDRRGNCPLPDSSLDGAIAFLLHWLEQQIAFDSIRAVGHRVVHGMRHVQPMRITPALLEQLEHISSVDPDHLPGEIQLIRAVCDRYPKLAQVACFDTAFHADMPRVAKLLPVPRRFDTLGIQRYGFHGLSYAYLMEELARVAGAEAATGKVILAHLGSGASLAAVEGGRSVDTSMGFTPAAGLPMGTRPGDLDPGAAWYMMRSENMTAAEFNHIINQESGLLGVSETSSDMRDLMERRASDVRAAEAVELFCYQVRKWVGAFAAVLGGLDTLVFAGGIGENTSEVRARVCDGLCFLGIELEQARNAANQPLISSDASRVSVRVIRTDEELMIAREVRRFLDREPR
jgi:acetate kinase